MELPTKELKLSFPQDWIFANRMAAKALINHPFFTIAAVVCAITMALTPDQSLAQKMSPYILQVVQISLGTHVVINTYAALRPEATARHVDDKLTRRAVGMCALYWTVTTLLGLLLLIPGIYFAVRGSMSMQALCIEGLGLSQSFNRSSELIKGNFLKTILYLGVAPLIPLALCIGILYSIVYLAGNYIPVPDSLSDKTIEYITDVVFAIPINFVYIFWELSLFVLMTKFYVYLLGVHTTFEQTAEAGNAGAKLNQS